VIGRFLPVAVVMAALLSASGCTGERRQTLIDPAPVPVRDVFIYGPIEIQPLHPPSPRVEPDPGRAPAPAAAPALPAHDAAWEASVAERPWRWIVIHHSASERDSAASMDAYHRSARHWDELGYHFVIGNGTGSGDGAVEVGSRWPKQKYGAHCRVGDNEEYNDFGIGICLVGNFERTRPTSAQMGALARLVDYLSAKYHINDAHIIGHGTVDSTRCPGRLLSFDDLFARLHAGQGARQAYASAR